MLSEGRQDFLYVDTVQFERCWENEDVCEIDNKEVIQEFSKDVIYEVLESGWGIA